MSTLTITLDDDTARLLRQAARAVDQPLEEWLRESIRQAAERAVKGSTAARQRVSPLHPGAMQTAPDFNAPLEEFGPYI